MIDVFNILDNVSNVQVFYNNSGIAGTGGGQPTGSTGGSWQVWEKPRGSKFTWITCIGGAAGGGGGGTTTAGSGGGSGAITNALFPSQMLPDTLFVWPGKGGVGGVGSTLTAGPAGTTGGKSLVAIRPVTSSIYTSPGTFDLVCTSGTGSWTSPTIGEAGNDSTSVSTYLARFLSLATWSSQDGQNYAAGNVTPLTNTILCTGAAGGASGVAGSSVLSVNLGSLVTPQISGGAIGGGNGQSGVWSGKPMFGTGGAGGGGGGTTGGNGGRGAYGCGGGGGGVGSTTGGNGGNGGDGLVIIVSF